MVEITLRPYPFAVQILLRVVFAAVALAAMGAGAAYMYLRQSLPQVEGEIRVAGLAKPAEVLRDAYGVPHIYAQSLADAAHALGYVHAQDRLWQMEVNRRTAAGRLSEVFGPSGLEADRFLRTLGVRRTAQANLRSNPQAPQADLVLRLQPLSSEDRYNRTPGGGLDPFPGFTIGVTLLQPRSVGSMHIQSRDPLQQAAMDPKYLSHEADAQLFLDGVRLARHVSQRPALKPLVVRETRPGPDVQDDAALLDYIRSSAQTSWHQIGTCKMGVDASAVVDPELRVHGIANLRVVDSGICPTIPSSNTNIASIAIGEKGADMLLETARA